MKALTGLSVSLLALKLGGVSTVGWGLIILPAALQFLYDCTLAYRAKRELDLIVEAIEKARENQKED
jgi:hypothetical protein